MGLLSILTLTAWSAGMLKALIEALFSEAMAML
jgi:hypothetical protein